MSETLSKSPSELTQEAEVRRLAYSDLPAVISIERRSFPTPWSLAMFVLELSKPSGICLAAEDSDGLAGYLVCARYDDVWHLMNVAVHPERRRRGIASDLIERLFEEAGPGARFTLEVRVSNDPAIEMYRRFGFRSAGRRRCPRVDLRRAAGGCPSAVRTMPRRRHALRAARRGSRCGATSAAVRHSSAAAPADDRTRR